MEAPADPKTAYDTARRELAAALQKKRAVDKSLVRFPFAPFSAGLSLTTYSIHIHSDVRLHLAGAMAQNNKQQGYARTKSIRVRIELLD